MDASLTDHNFDTRHPPESETETILATKTDSAATDTDTDTVAATPAAANAADATTSHDSSHQSSSQQVDAMNAGNATTATTTTAAATTTPTAANNTLPGINPLADGHDMGQGRGNGGGVGVGGGEVGAGPAGPNHFYMSPQSHAQPQYHQQLHQQQQHQLHLQQQHQHQLNHNQLQGPRIPSGHSLTNPSGLSDLPPPVLRPNSPSGSSVVSLSAPTTTRVSGGSVTGASSTIGPPSSVGTNGPYSAVSGTGPGTPTSASGAAGRNRPNRAVEETLLQHYTTLKRFLGIPYLAEVSSSKREATRSSRARDKLLRLSGAQVCELSQDVYDELLRRQAISGGPRGIPPPNPNVPTSLPPRAEFHDKRNQARQKLSSLQFQRFRDLAADVLCELERRFPYFPSADVPGRNRRQSPALSAASNYSNGRTSSNGSMPFPPRSTSRARAPSSLRMNQQHQIMQQQQQQQQQQGNGAPSPYGYPPGYALQSPPPMQQPVPRNGNPADGHGGGGGPNQMNPKGLGIAHGGDPGAGQQQPSAHQQTIDENGPLAKSSQSNTIVPVKSTLVEESDSGDDEDGMMRNGQRASRQHGDSLAVDKLSLKSKSAGADAQSARIAELEKLVDELRNQVSSRNQEKQQWEEERNTHKQTDEKLAESEAAYQAMEVELNALRRIHNEQTQQLGQSNDLEAQKKEWDEARAELEHQIHELSERNKELFADIERIQADHEYSTEQNATEFAQERRIWEEEKDILQVKLIQEQAKNDGIEARIEELELEHKAQLQKQAEQHTDGFSKETGEWEQLAKSLQAKLAETESQRLEAHEQLKELEEQHKEELRAEKEQWNEVVGELEERLNASEALSKELKDELTIQLREVDEKQKEAQEWESKYQSQQEEHVAQMKEVEKSMEVLIASGGAAGGAGGAGGGDWKKKYELLEQEYEELQRGFEQAVEAMDGLQGQLAAEKKRSGIKSPNSSTDGDDSDLRTRYESLVKDHHALKAELKEQQEVTEQVREQAQAFLVEMRQLSEEGGGNLEREESLNKEIQRLSEEVQLWKDRYAKTRTRLRGLRSSTLGLPGMEYNISLFKENDLLNPEGMVRDVHVTKFQMAIDELLRSARMGEPQIVLNKVKNVVTSVRGLNQDLEVVNANLSSREQGTLSPSPPSSSTLAGLPAPIRKLKARVASTANNLITATKNYSRSHGLSPVSLLDAAASHLCSAVVELVRAVKIRPTPIDELAEDEDEKSAQSPGMFSVAQSQVTGAMFTAGDGESIFSDFETPGRGSGAAAACMGNMGDMAANVSRLLNEHQKAESEKEGKSESQNQKRRDTNANGDRDRDRDRDSVKSDYATNPRSRPSSSSQNMDAQGQHGQRKYSTRMSNPPPRMQSLKIDEQDEELEDLRMYIDDQTMNLLKSTEALVKNVRATASTQSPTTPKSPEHKYHPSAVREHLDTITAIVEHVSIATEQILTSPTPAPANMKLRQELHRQVTPIVEQLSREREDFLYAIDKLSSGASADGNTRGQMVQRIEQVAYLLGRDMKCLVSGLDPQIEDAAGDENDVQPAAQHDQHQSQSKQNGGGNGNGHADDRSDGNAYAYDDDDDFSDYGACEVASVASVAQVGTPYKARSLYKQGS